jgi:hypothetical protein
MRAEDGQFEWEGMGRAVHQARWLCWERGATVNANKVYFN